MWPWFGTLITTILKQEAFFDRQVKAALVSINPKKLDLEMTKEIEATIVKMGRGLVWYVRNTWIGHKEAYEGWLQQYPCFDEIRKQQTWWDDIFLILCKGMRGRLKARWVYQGGCTLFLGACGVAVNQALEDGTAGSDADNAF